MRLFQWTDSHAAYVPEIDSEHRTLFRLADEFQSAVRKGAGAARLHSILQALIAAFEDHFSHEERLMRSSGYPAYVWHKRQHDGVRRRLREFARSIEKGDAQAPHLLIDYLAGWTRDHTGLTDRMLGAFLRNREREHALAS